MLKNPILPGFNPDPCICRKGDDYYMAVSTFEWFPGIPIYHSKDMKNWELYTHVLTDDEKVDLKKLPSAKGIWAPCMTYCEKEDQFYVVYGVMNSMNARYFDVDNFLITAKDIKGPWSEPVYLHSSGFDASILHDDDGRKYIVSLDWETRAGYEKPGAICMVEYDPEKKGGVEAVTRAKDEGYPIYAETCPQYLEFTSDVYKLENARNFVCSPPMKGEESRQALWAAIRRGDIDTIATDHCPFQSYEKDWGKDDFTKIPNGCAGIENMYPYMLSAANSGEITFEQAVALCSTNPARIFGCQKKGAIAVGMDADLVVYDPEMDFVITNDKMHSDCDHTIWEGCKLHGYPVQTYSRGRLVYENGEFLGEAGWGNFVKCKLK